jgi:YHS domain-containing protein
MAKVILWGILILLAVRALSRLLRGVLEGAGYRREMAPPQGVGLVRDPVCGVFVVPGQALTAGTGTATKYFCSEKCRTEWGKR